MEFDLEPGTYVVAVSGGVDSVVLLDLLSRVSGLDLVVAHYDHGIRPDSATDEKLVSQLAKQYSLPFISERGELGSGASEAAARDARYNFLRQAMKDFNAKAIITAHHQDDLLETMVMNVLRGTKRKGLTPFDNQPDIIRPLTAYSKQQLVDYAKNHNLVWREDSTNSEDKYRRNFIRHKVLATANIGQKQAMLDINQNMRVINEEIDLLVKTWLKPELKRAEINQLPHDISCEIFAAWLRSKNVMDFDKSHIEKLVVAAKTLPAGKQLDVINGWKMMIKKDTLALEHSEC